MRARLLLPVLVFVGCAASMDVDIASSPGTDFSKWKTYAWDEASTDGSDPGVDDAWVKTHIRKNVDKHLGAKGFRQSGTADFHVTYAVVRSEGKTASVQAYGVATILLKMIDPKIGKTVWRAHSRQEIEEGARNSKRERRLAALITRMLQDFPPPTAK